jgi:thiamine biosynthesis lipoprotein
MKKALFLIGLLSILFFVRQRPTPEAESFFGVAMTVPYKILVAAPLDDLEKHRIEEAIQAVFAKTHAIYNKWNPHSELSSINQAKADVKIPISKELEKMLLIVDKAYQQTGGRFDPTIEPAQKVWRASLEKGELPQRREYHIGWEKIELKEGYLVKKHPEMAIDLGGIAKGYTLDLLLEALQGLSYHNVLIEWGGDFVAFGYRPDGKRWSVGIRAPNSEDIISAVELSDEAFATSGDYLQYWSVGNKRYFHIFDPLTATPLEVKENSIASVTVRQKDGAMADAFATALMLFPSCDEAQEWLQTQHSGPSQTWLIPHSY